jgi:ABC-type multidrug transport system fused ATPase/permease subunit
VLKNISCKIKSGEKIGIVGRTGSGKTTILNTIIGIAELVEGDILIDGKKINEIPLKSLRREITVIDQEPVLINSTFRQNLDVFNQYQDDELIKIAKECSILDIIDRRGGLHGKVSNDTLSAGEKQLICICRALLKNSKIILIDEATANIDIVHDYLIQKVIS